MLLKFLRQDLGTKVVRETEPGKKLVLVINNWTIGSIAHQSFVLNLATDAPAVGKRVTG